MLKGTCGFAEVCPLITSGQHVTDSGTLTLYRDTQSTSCYVHEID